MNIFQSDAKALGSYTGLTQDKVSDAVKAFRQHIERAKVTKCEYKILRKFFSTAADAEKKKKDCIKAKEELTSPPWLIDFSATVHCTVKTVYEKLSAVPTEAASSKASGGTV